jgi:chloride channel protein, CIC family
MKRFELTVPQRLQLRENQIFLVLTILIGVLAGLISVLFTLAIKGTTYILFGFSPSTTRMLMVPSVVSVLTGFLLARFFPYARGSGVPQTEAAYHLQRGFLPRGVVFGKFITGVLCIGSGHSMGREGPSVQIGAGLASWIGRLFQLSPARVQSLVPVGAAAALAAAFNTPVAAVLFALEEIIGDMNASLIGSTVVASVSSVIVERSILGNHPIFHVPEYHLAHPAELAAYAVLGVVGGVVSLAFCKGLLMLRGIFLRMPGATRVFQPAMGGLAIGIILIFVPQVLGVGYEYVDQALNGGLLLRTMLLLCLAKLVATIVSYSSGNAGGIFAPSLYLGAMAGGAVGVLVHRFAPFPTSDPGAYALVGMGTLFAGIIRAPMTSVFMIFELTQDYQILVPLMIANMLSFLISRRYQAKPVYHALLDQDHVHLPGVLSRMGSPLWRARDVMLREVDLVPEDISIKQAARIMSTREVRCVLAGHDGRLYGSVMRADVDSALRSGRGDDAIVAIANTRPNHVHPDHPFDVVIQRLRGSGGALPVVTRYDVHHIEGVITPEAVVHFMDAGERTIAEEVEPPIASS